MGPSHISAVCRYILRSCVELEKRLNNINSETANIAFAVMTKPNFIITLAFVMVAWAITIFCATVLLNRLRLPYENGRYFDPSSATVIKEQSIIVISIVTVIFILISLIITYKFFRIQKW